jgi:hypothetical protein
MKPVRGPKSGRGRRQERLRGIAFRPFRFRDLDFVSIVVDLDGVADRAPWGAIGPMLIAPETDFRVVRPTIWHTHSFPSARVGPERSVGPKRAPIGGYRTSALARLSQHVTDIAITVQLRMRDCAGHADCRRRLGEGGEGNGSAHLC